MLRICAYETLASRLRNHSQAPGDEAGLRAGETGTLTDNSARDDRQSGLGQESRDGLTVGLELVLTPVLFGFIGWRLDRFFGSGPVLLVLFFVLVLAYEVWKLTARYGAEMDDEQRRLLGGGK